VNALRRLEAEASGADRLVRAGSAFTWTWAEHPAPGDLRAMLWAVVHSAIELLTSPELARVKECPGGGETPCAADCSST
jgi:predicted RNA-binding Zn ribbon-like protein